MAPPLQGTNAALSRRVTVWDDLDLSSIVQKKKKKKKATGVKTTISTPPPLLSICRLVWKNLYKRRRRSESVQVLYL